MERKEVVPSTMAVYRAGIRFFVEKTLGKSWPALNLFRFRRPRQLPDILTVEEVKTILDAVRVKRNQICLKIIYACGLRLSEAVSLASSDIDGARHLLKVCGGKGRKDRYVPIPEALLQELRDYWRTHRPTSFLFFGADKNKRIRRATIQKTFKLVLKEVGITKKVSVHTLRHSYATHLLDGGVGIRTIQEILGHSSLQTTTIYAHLSEKTKSTAMPVVDNLINQL
jgi:site-specific recombinase XerD